MHYYSPFEFTHQGANWVISERWMGTKFEIKLPILCSSQKEAIDKDIEAVKEWGDRNNRPVAGIGYSI